MNELLIIILGLINYRLCVLLIEEEAPFGVAIRFRLLIGISYHILTSEDIFEFEPMQFEDIFDRYKQSMQYTMKKIALSELSRLFSCIWCLSIWIGFFLCFVFQIHFLFAFAMSAIAVIIDKYMDSGV